MREQDRFSEDMRGQNGHGLRGLVRSALGRLGAGGSVKVGPEVELYDGSFVPPKDNVLIGEIVEADKVLIGEIVDDEVGTELPRTERFKEENMLGRMEIGEERYTVPWAMAVTESGHCFLDGVYPSFDGIGGTFQMKVERREDGYVVHVPSPFLRQRPVTQIPRVGAEVEDLLPVRAVYEVTKDSYNF